MGSKKNSLAGSYKSNNFAEVREEDNGSEATSRQHPTSKFKKEYEEEDNRDTSPTSGKKRLYADIMES